MALITVVLAVLVRTIGLGELPMPHVVPLAALQVGGSGTTALLSKIQDFMQTMTLFAEVAVIVAPLRTTVGVVEVEVTLELETESP